MPSKAIPKKERKPSAPGISMEWKLRLGLLLAVAAAYANSFGLGLAFDSTILVQQDTRIRKVSSENLKLIAAKPYWYPAETDRLYRPVTTGSFLFNYAVLGNGTNPAGYHWLNFLLHAVNTVLVFELALLAFGRAGPAFFAALLWAVHPIATESVTYVAGRADLLAAMSLFGGLLVYAKSRKPMAAAALFAIALFGVFSKENAAVLAGLMLLWDVCFPAPRPRAAMYAAAAAALGTFLLARFAVFRAAPVPFIMYIDNPTVGAGFLPAKLTALKVLAMQLWLLVFPSGLSIDRGYNQIPLSAPGDPAAWLAVVLIGGILAVVVARYRKDRVLFFAAGFFAIAILPTSNLAVTIGSIFAERFLYVPAFGFAVAITVLAYRFLAPRTATAALALLALLFAGRTLARNPDWNDNLAIAAADVKTTPNSYRLHDTLGQFTYMRDPQNNLDFAIHEMETAWNILSTVPADQPYRPTTPANLGMYYGRKGDSLGQGNPAARAWYEKGLAVLLRAREIGTAAERAHDRAQLAAGKPLAARFQYPAGYIYLGVMYTRLNRRAEAIEAYRYARGLDPTIPEVYDYLANGYAAQGDNETAATMLLEKALALGSTPRNLAVVRAAYAKVPGGECAVAGMSSAGQLNFACPRVQDDLCPALKDLAQAFRDARQADRAAGFSRMRAQSSCGGR